MCILFTLNLEFVYAVIFETGVRILSSADALFSGIFLLVFYIYVVSFRLRNIGNCVFLLTDRRLFLDDLRLRILFLIFIYPFSLFILTVTKERLITEKLKL